MFSTKEQLIKKTGEHGIGRLDFLQQLVNEYKATKSRDAKQQVIANLANFAYDPVNYEYLWRLKVLDLFFGALDDTDKKIASFAIGGICNICLDPLSREYILRNNGVQIISNLLSHNEESIVLSSITTLMYLDTPNSRNAIASPENINRMLEFSKSTNRRIKNLANIFLEDICGIKVSKEFTTSACAGASSSRSASQYTSVYPGTGISAIKNTSKFTSTITSADLEASGSTSTITSADLEASGSTSTITSVDIEASGSTSEYGS